MVTTNIYDSIMVSIYGIMYTSLKKAKLLESNSAKPKKLKRKDITQQTLDSLDIYKFVSNKVKKYNDKEVNSIAKEFNLMVSKLKENYSLNNYLLSLFLFDNILYDKCTNTEIGIYGEKNKRAINTMIEGIINHNGEKEGRRIVRESSYAAFNTYNLFYDIDDRRLKDRKLKDYLNE